MQDSRGEADRWLRQAENDLDFGNLALKERFFSQACFIAQQTAEKAMKAVAYGLGDRIVLGHSLVQLFNRITDRVPDAAALRETAGVLDQYYVPTRYPNGLPGGVRSRHSPRNRRVPRSLPPNGSWLLPASS